MIYRKIKTNNFLKHIETIDNIDIYMNKYINGNKRITPCSKERFVSLFDKNHIVIQDITRKNFKIINIQNASEYYFIKYIK